MWEITDSIYSVIDEQFTEYTSALEQRIDKGFSQVVAEFREGTHRAYFDSTEWDEIDARLFEWIKNNPENADKINANIRKTGAAAIAFQDRELIGKTFSHFSNDELAEFFSKFDKAMLAAHLSGQIWNVLEIKNQRLSGYLTQYVYSKIPDKKRAGDAAQLLLTQNEIGIMEEINEEIFAVTKSHDKQKLEKLEKLYEKSKWFTYNYLGPEMTRGEFESYAQQLKNTKRINVEKIKEKQTALLDEINADDKHRHLFKVAQDIIFLKGYRKELTYRGCWAAEPLYREIGKRLNLSFKQVTFLKLNEVVAALNGELAKEKCAELCQKRFKLSVTIHTCAGSSETLGVQAEKTLSQLNILIPDISVSELKGQTAFPGKVTGVVKIVNITADIHKVKPGDVLVSNATSPNLLPAMQIAAAFVTDLGGITCHAAIVSREMQKPCIIGTKIATKVFKDGDVVEVDTSKGTVRKIK